MLLSSLPARNFSPALLCVVQAAYWHTCVTKCGHQVWSPSVVTKGRAIQKTHHVDKALDMQEDKWTTQRPEACHSNDTVCSCDRDARQDSESRRWDCRTVFLTVQLGSGVLKLWCRPGDVLERWGGEGQSEVVQHAVVQTDHCIGGLKSS